MRPVGTSCNEAMPSLAFHDRRAAKRHSLQTAMRMASATPTSALWCLTITSSEPPRLVAPVKDAVQGEPLPPAAGSRPPIGGCRSTMRPTAPWPFSAYPCPGPGRGSAAGADGIQATRVVCDIRARPPCSTARNSRYIRGNKRACSAMDTPFRSTGVNLEHAY